LVSNVIGASMSLGDALPLYATSAACHGLHAVLFLPNMPNALTEMCQLTIHPQHQMHADEFQSPCWKQAAVPATCGAS
jgi:hypothetical protein